MPRPDKYTPEQDVRRHALLGLDATRNRDVAHFEGMSAEILDALIAEGFADPDDCQNASPSIEEFARYLGDHPDATAHGYIITNGREDRRISIEGLHSNTENPDDQVEFLEWNNGADELDRYRSWWD